MQRWTHVLWLTATFALGCTSGIRNEGSGGGDGSHTDGGGSGGGNNNGGGGNGGGGNTATDGGTVKDPGTGPTCGTKTFGLQKVPPDLLIVQDRSGSMDDLPDGTACGGARPNPMCDTMAKWTQVTAAIDQVVTQTQTTIRWGLKFFPDSRGADQQCGVNAAPTVPIADMNAMTIST